MDQPWLWAGFNAFVLTMLALDLGVFHWNAHVVSVREAAAWSAAWVALALGFGGGVYRFMGEQGGMEFLTGYLILVETLEVLTLSHFGDVLYLMTSKPWGCGPFPWEERTHAIPAMAKFQCPGRGAHDMV